MNPAEENKQARSAAIKHLVYRSRSESEIETHLSKKEFSDAAIASALQDLRELGYLNDADLAFNWGRSKIENRLWGPMRLKQGMLGRGLPKDVIRNAIALLYNEFNESELAHQAALKKLKSMDRLDRETQRRRLAPYLQRKGFSGDVVYETVQTLLPFRRE
ncbi:MAG: regulatory protein RecX [Candidatus Nitrohelix vancouverensis]|uniref:Regulatory protein RecX n=1 Tax=Candidatus Nitrohelix vancouverensis TaxID=2705534 RepID=A0A7T0C586_9BACT|nr:MAG: regulatory protein RecX [Candidatus Nitrohelix vancouverensis]